ncbi:MAG: ferric iron reductase, partial [Bdellovibrionales bacterium]|nr:ferric iron reductase [Bdellovibrionales bacterium]
MKRTLLFLSAFVISCQTPTTIKREIAAEKKIAKTAQQLVDWETLSNSASSRSNKPIEILHYEIPLNALEKDFDKKVDPALMDSLIFEKNSEKYVRWIINPDDTKWHLALKEYLDSHNLDSNVYKFFTGYYTASRSMIVVNPESGATLSLKVSSNNTGGKWTDKKQTWEDAVHVRKMVRYVSESMANAKTNTVIFMDEPMVFGIKGIDQGMVVRSINDVAKNGHYYMPAFAAMHSEMGIEIAQLNDSYNVNDFWDKHLNEPLARAMAEFFAYTGAWYESPHAQNFLIELDKNMKPTGRIVFRDFGDTLLVEDFINNTNYKKAFEGTKHIFSREKGVPAQVGLLHGNDRPSWMSEFSYKKYVEHFYAAFEKRFSELSDIPIEELEETGYSIDSFAYKAYPVKSKRWQEYFKYANCFSGGGKTLDGLECPEAVLKK